MVSHNQQHEKVTPDRSRSSGAPHKRSSPTKHSPVTTKLPSKPIKRGGEFKLILADPSEVFTRGFSKSRTSAGSKFTLKPRTTLYGSTAVDGNVATKPIISATDETPRVLDTSEETDRFIDDKKSSDNALPFLPVLSGLSLGSSLVRRPIIDPAVPGARRGRNRFHLNPLFTP